VVSLLFPRRYVSNMKCPVNFRKEQIATYLTERRNLFVHCDGVVSSQYLSVCKEHPTLLKAPKLGTQLVVEPDYFQTAYRCIYEIGVKLGHVLWRKLKPNEIEAADESLLNLSFELLQTRQYELAKTILVFASETLKKHSSDQFRRIYRINLAIACKWSGDESRCRSILDAEDWSSCSDRFHLAVAVLKDQFKEAGKIMIKVGSGNELPRSAFVSWPLFKEFRKSKDFLEAYKEIFKTDFAPAAGEEAKQEPKIRKSADSMALTISNAQPSPSADLGSKSAV